VTEVNDDAVEVIAGAWIAESEGEVRLRISRCTTCGSGWFPPRPRCARCHSAELADELTESRGELYASAMVRFGAAGFQAPYVLGYLDVSGVRVLTHVRTDTVLPPGTPVRLQMGSLPRNPPVRSFVAVVDATDPTTQGGGAP
jgi:hypothetical protein